MDAARRELIRNTQSSVKLLIAAALALPKDKRDWSPGGLARTATDIVVECASFPGWITASLHGALPSHDEGKAISQKIKDEHSSLDGILEVLKIETDAFIAMMEKFPEAELIEEMTFPWGTYTKLGVMGFHYWNTTYHLGQINFMQLVLGDPEMHL